MFLKMLCQVCSNYRNMTKKQPLKTTFTKLLCLAFGIVPLNSVIAFFFFQPFINKFTMRKSGGRVIQENSSIIGKRGSRIQVLFLNVPLTACVLGNFCASGRTPLSFEPRLYFKKMKPYSSGVLEQAVLIFTTFL